jgi:hypothetical protein
MARLQTVHARAEPAEADRQAPEHLTVESPQATLQDRPL